MFGSVESVIIESFGHVIKEALSINNKKKIHKNQNFIHKGFTIVPYSPNLSTRFPPSFSGHNV